MDLTPYNPKYTIKSNGFINMGNTCYINSLLQALISCTSIFEVLDRIKDKPHVLKNPIALYLLDLFHSSKKGESINRKCINIWKTIIEVSNKRKDNNMMQLGQQEDAHEGLMIMLDIFDTIPEIAILFQHRYCKQIYCDVCKKIVVDKKEINSVLEADPNLKIDQIEKFKNLDSNYNKQMSLNQFILKQNSYVDENFICPNLQCKSKGFKFMSTYLTMVPEILPIVLKKYNRKIVTPFPEKLYFDKKNSNERLVYMLVACIDHIGNRNGGHYYSFGLREDGWKLLNDMNVLDNKPEHSANNYVLIYHYSTTEKIKLIKSKSDSNLLKYKYT